LKPANDPTIDYKALVRTGYDQVRPPLQRYNEVRDAEPPSGLDLLTGSLRPRSRILDIGCGAGIPITNSLANRFSVTGVDFSAEQIQRARVHVPQANFIESDIMALHFPSGSFDGVVAFFVLFHLPCDEQRELLQRVHAWLVPGTFCLQHSASSMNRLIPTTTSLEFRCTGAASPNPNTTTSCATWVTKSRPQPASSMASGNHVVVRFIGTPSS